MEKDIKCYALYNNQEQEKLYALANSKEELKEVSLNYLSGVWFEYDIAERKDGGNNSIENERFYKGKVKFADEIIKKEEEKTKDSLSSRMGDLR